MLTLLNHLIKYQKNVKIKTKAKRTLYSECVIGTKVMRVSSCNSLMAMNFGRNTHGRGILNQCQHEINDNSLFFAATAAAATIIVRIKGQRIYK